MKSRIGVSICASLVLFMLLILPTFAHHGNASYDNKTVTIKGVVTEWRWTNPHSFLKFDAKDEKGNVVQWIGEWNNPSTLLNFGITAKSFKVGDEATVPMNGIAKSAVNLGRVGHEHTPRWLGSDRARRPENAELSSCPGSNRNLGTDTGLSGRSPGDRRKKLPCRREA